MDDAFARREARYRKFREKNPDAAFSRYLMEQQLKNLRAGPGALKIALAGSEDFWSSGEAKAKKLIAAAAVEPHHKVIEYGCGSLRIAAHFIRHLAPGNFFGLDVVSGFYEAGRATIGDAMIAEKTPHLAVIDETSLRAAETFEADFIYSNVVCVHVHPDEIETYFANLARLTHKPGARLIFNAALSQRPVRYAFDGWAWPEAFYKDALSALTFVRATTSPPQTRDGHEITPVEFEFHR